MTKKSAKKSKPATKNKSVAKKKSATEKKPWYDEWAEVIFGGNTKDRYNAGDIICCTSDHMYQMPDDVQTTAPSLEKVKIEKEEKGQQFFNGHQIRLKSANVTSFDNSSDGTNKPLTLQVEQTKYYFTCCTNGRMNFELPDGKTIKEKYAGEIRLSDSKLSDPIAVNLSVVTSDNKIFVSERSPQNASHPAAYQPAVSGNGIPNYLNEEGEFKEGDIDDKGNYDPFLTAMREAVEEVTSEDYKKNIKPSDITFFGYAKTLGTRYPFLFGELRLPITSQELLALSTKRPGTWEGKPFPIPFTIEDVTKWILGHRTCAGIGTTFFSLYQSLIHQYPEDILEIQLGLDKSKQKHDTGKVMEKIYDLLVLPFVGEDELKYNDEENPLDAEYLDEQSKATLRNLSNKDVARHIKWKGTITMLSKPPYKQFFEICRKIQNESSMKKRGKLKDRLFKKFKKYLPKKIDEEKQKRYDNEGFYISGQLGSDKIVFSRPSKNLEGEEKYNSGTNDRDSRTGEKE